MPLFSRHNSPARANVPASARLAAPATRHMPVAPPAPGAMASTLLKRYRPLETRATGGFGSVEVCMDTRLQRRVAIKRIPLASPLSVTPESTRAAALAEARTASMLQHPNIVSVIDFSYDAEYAYLVMEYIDGMSLEEFLAAVEGSSLTYDECAAIADALVQALAFAHENGVLHLDIKPGNVLIDHNGHVKLTDFGMATLTSAAGFGGARGGTIGYMAPEQLRGEVVDERSDIFSLAAVLYESLCATAPFRAGTPADSLKRIEKGVIYPSSLLADIPQNTEEALLAALDPDPAQRPASVQEFGDWLLPGLGSSREGRKSLARIIAQLTSDEAADAEDAESVRERRVWELDPAEGYLGSRDAPCPRRRLGCGERPFGRREHRLDPCGHEARTGRDCRGRRGHGNRRRHCSANRFGTHRGGLHHHGFERDGPHRSASRGYPRERALHRLVVRVGPAPTRPPRPRSPPAWRSAPRQETRLCSPAWQRHSPATSSRPSPQRQPAPWAYPSRSSSSAPRARAACSAVPRLCTRSPTPRCWREPWSSRSPPHSPRSRSHATNATCNHRGETPCS